MSQTRVCRHQLLLCCLLLLCAGTLAMPAQLPVNYGLFQQIGSENDIPDNVVSKLVQDKQGYLWIATTAGLIRYDGYRFRQHLHQADNPHSLAGNFIYDLLQRSDNTIWLLTSPGGISIYTPETEQFRTLQLADPLQQSALLQNARVMQEGPDGKLYFGGRQGLSVLSDDQQGVNFIFGHAGQPPVTGVRALLSTPDGMFIGASEGLFYYQYGDQHLQFLAMPWKAKEASTQVLSLLQSINGDIWIGTVSQGLFRLELATLFIEHIPNKKQDRQSEPSIFSMLQMSDNEIWIARFDGIARLQTDTKQWLSHYSADVNDRFSLAHNDVRTLLKDQAGQIWVGGYGGGVQRYAGQPAIRLLRDTAHKGPFSLKNTNISSILERSNGEIWLGSRGNGIEVLDRQYGVIKHIQPNAGQSGHLQQGWITSMAEHSDGSLWLGVNPAQLYRLTPDDMHVEPISIEQGFWQVNVRKLFTDSRQRLWLGSSNGAGLWREDTQQFHRLLDKQHQHFTDYVNGFAEDAQQQLWLASGDNGLFRINPETLIAEQPALSTSSVAMPVAILGLLYDAEHRLWLDTSAGLFVIHDTSATLLTITPAYAISHMPPYQQQVTDFGANMLQDNNGYIWTQRQRYDPGTGHIIPLTVADGVFYGTNWFRSYYKTRDGLMLFGGSDGVLLIDPEHFKPWQYQPAVQASAILIDGQTQNAHSSELTVPADARSFSIEFSGLDLSAPNRLQYRYQLKGYDTQWRYTDASQRQASYTNLWPGHYQLIVETTNRNQQWSPLHYQLDVEILPAFWQSRWFAMLLVLLLLLFIYSIIKLRTRMLRRQALLLALEVTARTDELKALQKDLVEKEKMAALGQVVAGIAHEINTPLGISVTAGSLLFENTEAIQQKFEQKTLTSNQMYQYLLQSLEQLQLLNANLHRSADLVQSFKEIAVDNRNNSLESVNIKHWLEQRLSLFGPSLNMHQVNLNCPANLQLHFATSALETVLFQLLHNSLLHGFTDNTKGQIDITLTYVNTQCILHYRDNGSGVVTTLGQNIFEPFVTSKRGSNCKGLGLHLCYNLMTQVLGGSIELLDNGPTGAVFRLTFPASDKAPGSNEVV